MPGPARITIELEPAPGRRGRWVTRTRVDGTAAVAALPEPMPSSAPLAVVEPHAPEPREPAVVPVAYEAVTDCTCVEGWCDIDHANA